MRPMNWQELLFSNAWYLGGVCIHSRLNLVVQLSRAVQMKTVLSRFSGRTSGSYRVIQPFLDPSNELCKKRLDNTLIHMPVKLPQKEKKQKHGNFDEGDRDQGKSQSEVKKKWVDYRLRCINCCEKCKQGKCYPIRKHGRNMERQRLGQKSVHYCPTCGVVLCNFCWQKFHSNDIELPPCSPFLHMLRTTTRCTTELEQQSERTFILRRQVSLREDEEE